MSRPRGGVSAVNRKRLLIPMFAAALIVATAASALAAASAQTVRSAHQSATKPARPHVVAPRRLHARRHVNAVLVRRLRRTTWRWQSVIGLRRAHSFAPLHTQRALRYWRRQARHVARLAAHPPHKAAWLCIHRFEGGWHDGGDPYWGGLQMD